MHQSSIVVIPLDQSADPLDQVFEAANPNPERRDCPSPLVLRLLARRGLPIDHPGYVHLSRCSPCYREFRTWQRHPTDVAAAAAGK